MHVSSHGLLYTCIFNGGQAGGDHLTEYVCPCQHCSAHHYDRICKKPGPAGGSLYMPPDTKPGPGEYPWSRRLLSMAQPVDFAKNTIPFPGSRRNLLQDPEP